MTSYTSLLFLYSPNLQIFWILIFKANCYSCKTLTCIKKFSLTFTMFDVSYRFLLVIVSIVVSGKEIKWIAVFKTFLMVQIISLL